MKVYIIIRTVYPSDLFIWGSHNVVDSVFLNKNKAKDYIKIKKNPNRYTMKVRVINE